MPAFGVLQKKGVCDMGLIQFAKNVGRKLGIGDDDEKEKQQQQQRASQAQQAAQNAQQLKDQRERKKAAALVSLVNQMGFKAQDLGVRVDDDKVTLTGQVNSQEEREKIVLLVGNTEGIGSVDDQLKVARPEPEAQFYEVKSGDTLSKIAKQHYGDANKYNAIFEANRPMLKDPDEIYPGQKLRIPAAQSAGVRA
jgi:nucleoid-associated protein YgaU